jgi:dTDP-glucose pyrophosphorylase
VVNNIDIDAQYIFIVQKEHRENYNLDATLNSLSSNVKIVNSDQITQGAACTILLAKEYIDNDTPLLLVNADQLIEWNSSDFLLNLQKHNVDGCIITVTSNNPMYSFAKVNEHNVVTEVAEKNPISDQATVGFYYWSKGSDFVKYATQMINKNIRVNGEFYSCPVYNEAIQDGKLITSYDIDKMWSLGTPDDLDYYLIHGLGKI